MGTAEISTSLIALVLAGCASTSTPAVQSPPESPAAVDPVAPTTAEAAPEPSARPAEWGYEGAQGPAAWSALDEAYSACGNGHFQSPVDLPTGTTEKAEAFQMSYGAAQVTIAHHEHVDDIVDNGHTMQVTVKEGATIATAKDTYRLKQFHFHTPSENKVDGKQYPMEAHFVHQSDKGAFAVLAVFFEAGAQNPQMQKLIDHFPAVKGKENAAVVDGDLDLNFIVPKESATYHFVGSFTTPPCTEDVEWLVLKDPRAVSEEQLAAFSARLGHNNRPIQDWQSRPLSDSPLNSTKL